MYDINKTFHVILCSWQKHKSIKYNILFNWHWMLVQIQSSNFEAREETPCTFSCLTNICKIRLHPDFIPRLEFHHRHITPRAKLWCCMQTKSATNNSINLKLRAKVFTRVNQHGPVKDIDPWLLTCENSRFRIIRPTLVEVNFVEHDFVVVWKVSNVFTQFCMECIGSPILWMI